MGLAGAQTFGWRQLTGLYMSPFSATLAPLCCGSAWALAATIARKLPRTALFQPQPQGGERRGGLELPRAPQLWAML